MSKGKSIKNYIILIVVCLCTMGITLYLCNWYEVYNEYQKQIPVIRGTLSEITNEELEHYIMENPTATIYMCTSADQSCRNYEKDLKKIISKYNLEDSMIYLNLSDINQEEFVKNFNSKYPNKVSLKTNYPAIVKFEDGKITYLLQGSDTEKLTVSKTEQYIELNNIGE